MSLARNSTQSQPHTYNWFRRKTRDPTYLIRHIHELWPLRSDPDDPQIIHAFLCTYTSQYKSFNQLMTCIVVSISTLTATHNIQKAKYDINTQRYHQVSIIYILTAFPQGPLATVTDPCILKWAWHATQHNHSPIHTIDFAEKHVTPHTSSDIFMSCDRSVAIQTTRRW